MEVDPVHKTITGASLLLEQKQVRCMAEAGVGLTSFLRISEEEQCGHTKLQSVKQPKKKTQHQHLMFQTMFMHKTAFI